jgi:8-oxo-dGTP diphosphatase
VELPGRTIEVGESPRQAAVRELREETGQQPRDLHYVGLATFRLPPDGRLERAALFQAHVNERGTFTPNDEIESVFRWEPDDAGAGMGGIDAELVQLCPAG